MKGKEYIDDDDDDDDDDDASGPYPGTFIVCSLSIFFIILMFTKHGNFRCTIPSLVLVLPG